MNINTYKKMNKICLLEPYYGTFPNYFHLWIKSASLNPNIDFYIISDSFFPYELPPNIFLINMSLGEIKERLENAIGVSIKLPQPYKLCDYKPAYGLIFDDIVSKYDYWGWCDPDIIFGDLSLIFNKETLNEFDVIGGAGSMTIFKNTDFLKRCFLYTNPSIPSFSFDEIRCTSQSMIFDE